MERWSTDARWFDPYQALLEDRISWDDFCRRVGREPRIDQPELPT